MEPWSFEPKGRFEEHALESRALQGNPLGDPHDRPLWVYLPPGYDEGSEARYPSVYAIQGLTGQLGQYGPQFMSRAESAFGPAQDYWSRILRGDRGAVTQALAPEIESLISQQQRVQQMQGELQPRGGPGAAYMAQLPYQTAGQIGGMISQARQGAAAGMGQLGGEMGRLGLGALGEQDRKSVV